MFLTEENRQNVIDEKLKLVYVNKLIAVNVNYLRK